MKFDIVIAGGGFAGATCAKVLGKALGGAEGKRRVGLIAESNVLVFAPMVAEVAGSTLGPLDVVNPLRQFCRHATVLQGAIQKIDWGKKELLVDGGRFTRNRPIGFDRLVVALGSVTNLTHIPGMSEHGWPVKNVADALRLRSAMINRLEEANLVEDPASRARLLTFVVVGGGYTGVETAGQMNAFLKNALRFYPDLSSVPLRVILIHSGAALLPEIGPSLGNYAMEVLKRRGVDVRLNKRVQGLTARKVLLGDGEFIESHTVVTTIGNAPNPVVTQLASDLKLEAPKGRLAVDPDMSVPGVEGLWAIGDCAAVPWNDKGTVKTSPPTAQFAVRQGRQCAQNLLRKRSGQGTRPFQYRYLGQLATIGEREAVAEVLGMHFRGFFAWWLWRTIYLAKLPGALRRLRVTIDWTFDLVFPRDISIVAPPPDDIMRGVHLEEGEKLFSKGSIARAVFYVRAGKLRLGGEGAGREVGAGEVIDVHEADEGGLWTCDATAAETCDLIVFRGRAYPLMKNELKVVPRKGGSREGGRKSAEEEKG